MLVSVFYKKFLGFVLFKMFCVVCLNFLNFWIFVSFLVLWNKVSIVYVVCLFFGGRDEKVCLYKGKCVLVSCVYVLYLVMVLFFCFLVYYMFYNKKIDIFSGNWLWYCYFFILMWYVLNYVWIWVRWVISCGFFISWLNYGIWKDEFFVFSSIFSFFLLSRVWSMEFFCCKIVFSYFVIFCVYFGWCVFG